MFDRCGGVFIPYLIGFFAEGFGLGFTAQECLTVTIGEGTEFFGLIGVADRLSVAGGERLFEDVIDRGVGRGGIKLRLKSGGGGGLGGSLRRGGIGAGLRSEG